MNPSTRAKAEEVARAFRDDFSKQRFAGINSSRDWFDKHLADALLSFSDSQNRELREALRLFKRYCHEFRSKEGETHLADVEAVFDALLSQPDGKETK